VQEPCTGYRTSNKCHQAKYLCSLQLCSCCLTFSLLLSACGLAIRTDNIILGITI
jgi:hypothetical protein